MQGGAGLVSVSIFDIYIDDLGLCSILGSLAHKDVRYAQEVYTTQSLYNMYDMLYLVENENEKRCAETTAKRERERKGLIGLYSTSEMNQIIWLDIYSIANNPGSFSNYIVSCSSMGLT
jgi:hypothetical protein